jgi:hypothetical protein
MQMSASASFFPAAAQVANENLSVVFRRILPVEFADAFCDETVQRFARARECTLVIPRTNLEEVSEQIGGWGPVGIIFHVARCGSTLQAQLLKQLRGLVVYSEPPIINDLLMPSRTLTLNDQIAALRIIGRLLAEHANAQFVLKLRSWNTLFCRVIAAAFPTTPWVFCFRDPVEVGVSVLARPPTWLRVFGEPRNPFLPLIMPGLTTDNVSREQYVAHAFAAFCNSIADMNMSRGLLVNYEDLPRAVWQGVAQHFGTNVSQDERERMTVVAQTYSKCALGSYVLFQPDAAAKQRAASPELRAVMEAIAVPPLHRLKARLRNSLIRL